MMIYFHKSTTQIKILQGRFMKTLETQRMILRNWEISNLNDFSEIWTNPNVTIPQRDLPMQDIPFCLPILKHLLATKNNYALVLKDNGKVILNGDANKTVVSLLKQTFI